MDNTMDISMEESNFVKIKYKIFVSFVGKHTHPIPMLLEIQVFTESNYGMSCSPHYLVCKGKVSMVIL